MRQIKFRGKTSKYGEWIYGDLGFSPMGNPHVTVTDSGITQTDPGGDSKQETIFVDIKSIGQFTGLLDKNGKEIYEGDILNDRSIVDDKGTPFRGLIGFKDQAFRYVQTNCDCGKCLNSILLSGIDYVVGNIYENEKILK